MADTDGIFSNLPRSRRRGDDDDDRRLSSRQLLAMNFVPEGPLPQRPRPSGKGGPSVGQGGSGTTGSVWSAADAAANAATLSNGGLTVQFGSDGSVRGSSGHSSGKYYFEVLLSATILQTLQFGVGNAAMLATNYLGASPSGFGATVGTNYVNGFVSNYTASYNPVAGDVAQIAVDFAGSVWLNFNNSQNWFGGNPATGSLPMATFTPATVGLLFPAIATYPPGAVTATLQSTPASQKYLPPPGFQAWDGGPVTPPASSVWSASDAAANGFTLSNGGLTYADNANVNKSIRGTVGLTSGKAYVEFLAVATGGNYRVGLASAGFNSAGQIGASNYSGAISYNANFVSSGFTSNLVNVLYATGPGHVIGLAVDFAAGNMWYSVDNVWANSSNPATGTSPAISFVPATVGALFPAFEEENASESWTLQPTPASQKYAPPSGFTPWG